MVLLGGQCADADSRGALRTMRGNPKNGPSSRARAGLIKDRTINVSRRRPMPAIEPNMPTEVRPQDTMAVTATANTMPAVVTSRPDIVAGRIRPVLSSAPSRRRILDERDVEASGPEDAEDAVLIAYAGVAVNGVALLKPCASRGEHFVLVRVVEVVPEAAGDDHSVVIVSMNVGWSGNAGGVFHQKCRRP